MAAGYSAVGKNLMLDALAAAALKAALYTDDPGATGTTNEVTGGDPAYARKAIAWNAAADGNINLDGTAVFDVPASSTVAYVGFWNSAGSVFYGSAQVTSETFAAQGTYTLTDADLDLNG